MKTKTRLVTLGAVVWLSACGSQPPGNDPEQLPPVTDGGNTDGGGGDAGTSTPPDGGVTGGDAGVSDAGTSDAGPPTWVGTSDPNARLPLKIVASREVVRVPAADAPPSDSQSQLSVQNPASTGVDSYYWEVRQSDTGALVMSSTTASPTFSCPAGGRGTYDVWLRATSGDARVHLAERRLITCTLPRTPAGRTVHTLNLSTDTLYLQQGKIKNVTVMPGDVIKVSGAASSPWVFVGFVGSEARPIHIINDGLVTNSNTTKLLQIVNSQHLIVDGLGSDQHPYGFVFTNNNTTGEQAVFVRNYTLGSNPDRGSTDMELFGIHVAKNSHTGIEVVTGPGTAGFNRGNWVFDHLLVHHNRVENVGDEGFYIGYNNDKTDGTTGYAPYQIRGAKVYRNVIRNTQWDGLQVANCIEGLEVHDNHVSEAARERTSGQQSAFQYNSGNSGYVYRNTFLGAGSELQTGCTGGVAWVFDNVFDAVDAPAGGNMLYIHGGKSSTAGAVLFQNTFRARGGNGIAVNTEPASSCDGTGLALRSLKIVNNVFVFGTYAGATPYRLAGGAAPASLTITPNLVTNDSNIAAMCFKAPEAGDYGISCSTSPALNGSGVALGSAAELPLGVFSDKLGRVYADPRNFGAYQSHSP